MVLTLITFSLDYVLILLGENWSWSLLTVGYILSGVAYPQTLLVTVSSIPSNITE